MASNNATLHPVEVFGGVDTHKQTHAAAALDFGPAGCWARKVFPADSGGYEQLLGWSGVLRRAGLCRGRGDRLVRRLASLGTWLPVTCRCWR